MDTRTTRHGRARVRERTGLPKRAAARAAERAFSLGLPPTAFAGPLRAWLDRLYLKHGRANSVRAFRGAAWLFATDQRADPPATLLTVIPIPARLRPRARS